jgi:hypothetical protein
MHLSQSKLFLVAVPTVASSAVVLALAAVAKSVWIVQVLAICLACALAVAGAQLSLRTKYRVAPGLIVFLVLLGIAVPLFSGAPTPQRWASLGPIKLYIAPVVLPLFLAACSVWIARGGQYERFAFIAIVSASLLLAAQPDASQVLALLAASAAIVAKLRSRTTTAIAALACTALATAWAFSQPDHLQPVAHVEGVFALALDHSLFVGAAVIASAVILVVGLYVNSSGGSVWLSAIAVYYAVLFLCSVAGLTPAPLIGYGAGPWLGFGLAIAVAGALDLKVAAA